jgi:hypothetical protein
MTDLTYKIAAYKEITNFNTDECVDWAFELLEHNIETPSLLILASLSKPTNYFETISYLDKTLKELGLEPFHSEKAIIAYSYFYIKRISESTNVKNNLAMVCKFCIDHDYEKNVYDFYLLNWAWGDFDYGETYTDYWHTATKDNIESIVVKTANDWIAKHFEQIKILI